MAELLRMTKEFFHWMMGWIMGQNDEDCNCTWTDDEHSDVQESSGLGTVLVVSASLVGLFITANLIPSQGTQGPRSLREEELRKQQQVRRIRHLLRKAGQSSRKNHADIDNWQDALEPSEEDQEERVTTATNTKNWSSDEKNVKKLHLKLAQSMQEVFQDTASQKSDDDCYKEIQDD